MDYVVFGIGMGASLVLLGLATRAIGPMLRYRQSKSNEEVQTAVELVAQVAWARFCNALGAAIAFAGVFLLIVTGVMMAIRLDDGVASLVIGVALALVLVMMALWTWAFIGRFGLYGIVTHRTSDESASVHEPYDNETEDSADAALDTSFLSTVAEPPIPPAVEAAHTRDSTAAAQDTSSTATASRAKRTFSLRRNQKPTGNPKPAAATLADAPVVVPVRRSAALVSNVASTTAVRQPQSAEPQEVVSQVARPSADASRSEVVNPSDAAALDRILSGGDDAPDVDLDAYFFADPVPENHSDLAPDDSASAATSEDDSTDAPAPHVADPDRPG